MGWEVEYRIVALMVSANVTCQIMKLCFPSLRRRLWDNAAISPRHSKLDKIHTRRTTRVKAPKPFANERRPGDITNYPYFAIAVSGVTQQHRLQRETTEWGGILK